MKMIIFGSTGTIGQLLVKQALEAGHTVTAFLRDSSRLKHAPNPQLRIFEGNVLDFESVKRAVKGHDIVLCALGAGRKGVVRASGTHNIIRAMEALGIDRLLCQTTLGCGETTENLNFFWKRIMFGWFLKQAFLDHELQEAHIKQSKLSWTIIRPSAFTDGPVTRQYKQGFPSNDRSIKSKISRGDVAEFMLREVGARKYLREAVSISY